MGAKSRAPIVVIPIGDLHVGSSVALCHEDGVALEDGGHYMPNAAQLWLWDKWTQIVKRAEAERKRGAHIVGIFMGEFVDGRHHETTQLASQSPEIQAAAAVEVFGSFANACHELYVMRGTDAHSGHGAASDFALGRQFGARVDPATGQHAFYHLRLDVAGVNFDVAHHVTLGGDDVRLYGNAIKRETAAMAMEWPQVDIVLRGHVHRYQDTGEAFGLRRWGFTVPAWQLKTAFTHRISRREAFTVGTNLIRIQSGEWSRERLTWDVPQVPVMQAKANSTPLRLHGSANSSTRKTRSKKVK